MVSLCGLLLRLSFSISFGISYWLSVWLKHLASGNDVVMHGILMRLNLSKTVQCLKKYDQLVKDQCYPECRMPCSKITYSYISVDSFTLQQGACYGEDMFNQTVSDDSRKNFICLRVYYATAESEVYSHKPKYNGIQVFSIIGGYIGLWLGVSLLDVHGYLSNAIFLCFAKHKTKEKERYNNVKTFKKHPVSHQYH